MAAQFGIIGVSYIYLGGGPTLLWIIKVDICSCGEPIGKTINIEATNNNICLLSKPHVHLYLLISI
jgi:hypothetical protein